MSGRVKAPDRLPTSGFMTGDETAAEFLHRWYEAGPRFCTRIPDDQRAGTVCFSGALLAVKVGFPIRRELWQPGMFVTRQAGYPAGVPINANTADATGLPLGTMCTFAPYLMLSLGPVGSGRTPMFVPWTPAMLDILAADWIIDEKPKD